MKQAAWKFIQFSVFAAVLFSNIRYQWTPSGLAAGVVALLATLLVSAIPVMISDLAALWRRLARLVHGKRASDRPLHDSHRQAPIFGLQGKIERAVTSKRDLQRPAIPHHSSAEANHGGPGQSESEGVTARVLTFKSPALPSTPKAPESC
jgi:hypothetical protein